MTLSADPIAADEADLDDDLLPAPFSRGLGILLLIGGLIGLAAATTLLIEKIELLKNPGYVPSCSINPILSCGTVMVTPQAEVFGFPNPIIGVAGFGALVAIGAALLAGATFARWFWIGLQAGVIFGIVFIHWLIYQSLYVIGALCPYCMVVWAVMIPIFWYTTVHNLLLVGDRGPSGLQKVARVVDDYRGAILTAWFLIILGLITQRFWYFWVTLF